MNQNTSDDLTIVRLIRLKEASKLTSLSRSSIYTGIKDGTFPKPFKIGRRAIAWQTQDISQWIANHIANGAK